MRADTAAQYGAAAGTPVSTAMPTNQARPTPNASTSIPPAPPLQNYDPREEGELTPKQHAVIAPNHNQMMHMDKWASSDDAKENAPGDANRSRQLEDAKLRIEDAKKFIMSRNTRRATPTSQTARPPINNMTPGAQARSFRPLSMTPGSQAGYVQPRMSGTPRTRASPQMKTMSGPGSQANIFRPPVNLGTPGPQTYQNLGSLMSQESETSCTSPGIEHTTTPGTRRANDARMSADGMMSPGAQRVNDDEKFMSTPGTQNSGYRTPQMPGKYFFA